MRPWLGSVLLALLATGCGSAWHVQPLHAPPHRMDARPAWVVNVYTVPPSGREFVEVALFQQWGMKACSLNTWAQCFAAEGAKLGCDGVILHLRYRETLASCIVFSDGKGPEGATVFPPGEAPLPPDDKETTEDDNTRDERRRQKACADAQEYGRRASKADGMVRQQLERIGDIKRARCQDMRPKPSAARTSP